MTAPVVEEELALLESICDLLDELPPKDVPSEEPIIQELERLRDQLVGGQERKDAMALHEQFHRQSSLLRQLRVSRGAPQIDPRSPYFAHLRLLEGGEERDLCLGRAQEGDFDPDCQIGDLRTSTGKPKGNESGGGY